MPSNSHRMLFQREQRMLTHERDVFPLLEEVGDRGLHLVFGQYTLEAKPFPGAVFSWRARNRDAFEHNVVS